MQLTVSHIPTTTNATMAIMPAATIPTTEPVLKLLLEPLVNVAEGAEGVSVSAPAEIEGTEKVGVSFKLVNGVSVGGATKVVDC